MRSASLLYGLALGVAACAEPHGPRDLAGVWTGESQGRRLEFRLAADGTCQLSATDTAGVTALITGKYEADFSRRPIPLSIRDIPQLSHPLHTIVRLEPDGALLIAPFAPRWRLRPIAFDSDRSMRLRRSIDPPKVRPAGA